MINISNKEINYIKGEIRIVNTMNQLIKVRPIVYEKISFKAGDKVTQQELWPHDKSNQYDVALRNIKELIAFWVPETIGFTDGTKITLETQK
jgi:hypothetical protein